MFFDLEKAYDTAWRCGILLSLHKFGLRGRLPVFIQQFLANHFLRVRVQSINQWEHTPGGALHRLPYDAKPEAFSGQISMQAPFPS